MSSFKCSDYHFKQLRQKTYNLILADRYILYDFNLDYNLPKEEIKRFIDHNIYELYKINVASVNLQYRDTQINRVYDDYINNIGDINTIQDRYSNTMLSKNELIGLYNAYSCLNYQIELSYNKDFIDKIQKHIAINLIRKLSVENEEVNQWEYIS